MKIVEKQLRLVVELDENEAHGLLRITGQSSIHSFKEDFGLTQEQAFAVASMWRELRDALGGDRPE